MRDQVIKGMADIMFGMAWADYQEALAERDLPHVNVSGCEITSIMPDVPEEVLETAREWLVEVERMNEQCIRGIVVDAVCADMRAIKKTRAEIIDELSKSAFSLAIPLAHAVEEIAEAFGNDLAHMIEGSGVSWFDDHERFALKVPRREYGWLHMSPKVFPELPDEDEEDGEARK